VCKGATDIFLKERSEGGGRRGEPTPSQAGRPDQKQPSHEAGKDYSAALSSIRADQDVKTFVADLRQNKEPVLSLVKDLMTYPADTPEQLQTRLVIAPLGIYLLDALKEHVFDRGDLSFLDDVERGEWREELAFYSAQEVARRWLHAKPDSEAAKAVSMLGIYALPDQHHKLVQEMWPSTLYGLYGISQSEKKE
jgi:hypothetical protein